MGKRSVYAPGTFCWTDLATTDPAASKDFYGRLFGWTAVDQPTGGGGTYSMMHLGEETVCGLYERGAEHGSPAWLSYVSVDDAGAVTDRARAASATVLEEPFDVGDTGRLALITDPRGALLALWEPGRHPGASLVNEPGAMVLNQLNTDDVEACAAFYTEVFGWRIESVGNEDQPYWGVYNGDAINGGMMLLPAGSPVPPHWMTYFTAADLDAAVALVVDLAGNVLVPPLSVPSGRIAVVSDPQGASFAMFEGDVDP